MLVGGTLGGKSVCWKTLAKAKCILKSMGQEGALLRRYVGLVQWEMGYFFGWADAPFHSFPLPSGWVVMCPTWKNHVEATLSARDMRWAHRWGWISRLPGLWPIAVRCQGMEKVVFDIINPKSITMILGTMKTSPLRNGISDSTAWTWIFDDFCACPPGMQDLPFSSFFIQGFLFRNELYGAYDAATMMEWTDGVLSSIMRRMCQESWQLTQPGAIWDLQHVTTVVNENEI